MAYRSKIVEKHRLQKLYDATQHRYNVGAWYDSYLGIIKRVRHKPKTRKFLRRLSNKRVRRSNNITDGRHYTRVYDYWWELD